MTICRMGDLRGQYCVYHHAQTDSVDHPALEWVVGVDQQGRKTVSIYYRGFEFLHLYLHFLMSGA